MNSKRVYYGMLGLVSLLIVAIIGGAYGVNQLFEAKAKHLVDLKLQTQALTNQQSSLVVAKKEVATYSSLNQIAETVVPQDKDQAEAVREISNLAKASGIAQLSSVTFPASTLGGTVGSNVSTPTTGSAATNSSKNNLTQLTPVKGARGLYVLPITITQTSDSPVPYNEFLTFLSKLEQNRRTAQVTSLTLTPDNNNSSLVGFSLIINEFIRP